MIDAILETKCDPSWLRECITLVMCLLWSDWWHIARTASILHFHEDNSSKVVGSKISGFGSFPTCTETSVNLWVSTHTSALL